MCVANGITPDTKISPGADGAYQFWLTDPDGNRLELMEYTEDALQIKEQTGGMKQTIPEDR